MKNNDLIKHCRYYNGQKENPNTDDGEMSWFWDMERIYVEHDGKFTGERDYYERINGKKYSGIPYDLLIIMFTSWAKTVYDIRSEINGFYKRIDEYLFIPNDHFPEDEIPNRD